MREGEPTQATQCEGRYCTLRAGQWLPVCLYPCLCFCQSVSLSISDLISVRIVRTVEHDGTKLYSTHWNEKTFINVYSSSDFSFLSTIKADLPGEIQGAAFWEKEPRFLYTLSNGPYVHRVDTDTGDVEFVLKDDEYKHHVYEAEGITFMDLDGVGMGSLHIYGNFETIEEKSVHNFRVAV